METVSGVCAPPSPPPLPLPACEMARPELGAPRHVPYQGRGKKLTSLLLMAQACAKCGLGRWWLSAQRSQPPSSREGWAQRGPGQRKEHC